MDDAGRYEYYNQEKNIGGGGAGGGHSRRQTIEGKYVTLDTGGGI